MKICLTKGKVLLNILLFALPLMIGNLLQQTYNIVDTWIVGRFISNDALGAVGSAYSLMTFLTSIIIGLCIGSGTCISIQYGKNDIKQMKKSIFLSFTLIFTITLILNILIYIFNDYILFLLKTPLELKEMLKEYLLVIYAGFIATFLFNYYSALLRALGNSLTPLIFLAISTILNIILDILFVYYLNLGIKGAALATIISQFVSGIGLTIYSLLKFKEFHLKKEDMQFDKECFMDIIKLSSLTCIQQSIMNFGILLVQRLINSFGKTVMSAFSVAVKIDTFAYMPVQDFGNAFSTYVAQNYGANNHKRIKRGILDSLICSIVFCLIISSIIYIFSPQFMQLFVKDNDENIIAIGVNYLRIEGSFYVGIGILFLLYGYYRAINKPLISIILTILSLGSRVLLAYILSSIPSLGVNGIWMSIPIGWFIADFVGIILFFFIHPNNKQKVAEAT